MDRRWDISIQLSGTTVPEYNHHHNTADRQTVYYAYILQSYTSMHASSDHSTSLPSSDDLLFRKADA
jgi:hypothetical protein